jgi:phosphotransferase system  glucose/maltose/N-acetylglucosamine-specific IIC component
MAAETGIATTVSNPVSTYTGVKTFLLAHPVGVAIIGGIIVGTGTYWLVKKFSEKKDEPQPEG